MAKQLSIEELFKQIAAMADEFVCASNYKWYGEWESGEAYPPLVYPASRNEGGFVIHFFDGDDYFCIPEAYYGATIRGVLENTLAGMKTFIEGQRADRDERARKRDD